MEMSLHEKNILITREEQQGKQFAAKIRACQGNPVEVPLLKISCKEHQKNQAVFQQLASYQWIFFTSANGVRCFFQLAKDYQVNTNVLETVNIAVVGRKTENALKEYGNSASFIPSVYNAEVMSKEFFQVYQDVSPVLIVRGSKSLDILPVEFENRGIAYDAIEIYETTFRTDMKERLNEILKTGEIDFITFTSPSSVESFRRLTQVSVDVPVVCIGTTTEKRANQLGFQSILVPEEFTVEGMIYRMGMYVLNKELEDNDK
ncbi:uroporphyrinogen-III synthase [Virgibacillus oceani]